FEGAQGLGHAVHGAAEHGLDRIGDEGVLEGDDEVDVLHIFFEPAADAGIQGLRYSRTMAPLVSLSKVRTVWPRKSCMAVTNSRQSWQGIRSRWKVSPARERVT